MAKTSNKRGFTMIEVMLFLALSGTLMVGLIAGTTRSISRQRYNDSVNNFVEFVRGVYSDVENVQIDDGNNGRSGKAVYGRMIVIGGDDTNLSKVQVYTVVGEAVSAGASLKTDALDAIFSDAADGGVGASIYKTGATTPYQLTSSTIPWEATLENADGSKFYGTILIIRSPSSGAIRTYFYTDSSLDTATLNGTLELNNESLYSSASTNDLAICVDSPDNSYENRRAVIINKNSANSSGVMLSELNSDTNPCAGHAGD